MQGWHLTADLHDCAGVIPHECAGDATHHGDLMRDPQALRRLCIDAVASSGLAAVGECFHRFAEPGGVTGVLLLAESHLAVHTWPEQRAVTLDVYVCNVAQDNSAAAEALMAALVAAFGARRCARQRLARGDVAD
jgi:S-adenosylmethionine decarboxylase